MIAKMALKITERWTLKINFTAGQFIAHPQTHHPAMTFPMIAAQRSQVAAATEPDHAHRRCV